MSNEETTRRITAGGISLDDRLESIDNSLHAITTAIGEEKTAVALIQSKLALHDTILMGVCGTVGVAVISTILSLVLRPH